MIVFSCISSLIWVFIWILLHDFKYLFCGGSWQGGRSRLGGEEGKGTPVGGAGSSTVRGEGGRGV